MCDYSLEGLQQRSAKEKERLVLTKITSSTKGFVSPDDVLCLPVCLCEGTVVDVSGIDKELRQALGIRNGRAVFAQGPQTSDTGHPIHRDGLLFGETFVLLQRLNKDVRISVERIPHEEHTIEVLSGDTVKRRVAATVAAAIIFLGGFGLFTGHLPF